MPIYEYRCQECGTKTEALQKLGAGKEGVVCRSCGSENLEKIISGYNVGKSSGGHEAGSCGTGSCCSGGACGI